MSESLKDSGIILPGWNCASCLVFNGEEKAPQGECRSCGAARKTFGLPLESVMQRMRLLEENLSSVQTRCKELLEDNRMLRAKLEQRGDDAPSHKER
jgi:hypothetical protein